MKQREYESVGTGYRDAPEVPRDRGLFYRCTKCNGVIPSIPPDNAGCECGNVFIDKNYMRLDVGDYQAFEVVKVKRK